ncbi:MAG: hypothetical protein COB02_07075 [Candidatus Cloacimonadota bacterium]|nr:MAG: hypothetical protein COB02_07075 [Candidatus Cloacimonadota bacterium]
MNALRKEKTIEIKQGIVSKKTILTLAKETKKDQINKRYDHNEIQSQKIRTLTEQVGGLMKTLSVYKQIEIKSYEQNDLISDQQKQISKLELKLIEFSKEMYFHKSQIDQKVLSMNSQIKENTYKTSFAGLWETMKNMLFGY